MVASALLMLATFIALRSRIRRDASAFILRKAELPAILAARLAVRRPRPANDERPDVSTAAVSTLHHGTAQETEATIALRFRWGCGRLAACDD